jgi:hypothetical protein
MTQLCSYQCFRGACCLHLQGPSSPRGVATPEKICTTRTTQVKVSGGAMQWEGPW